MSGTGDNPRVLLSYRIVGGEYFVCVTTVDAGRVESVRWMRLPTTIDVTPASLPQGIRE